MTRRSIVFFLVPAALLLLAFGCKSRGTDTNETSNAPFVIANANQEPEPGVTNTSLVPTNVAVTPTNISVRGRTPTEAELQRLAGSFTERYGSYSNQTNFENIESLLFFLTVPYQREMKAFVERERAKARDTSVYYGITTRTVAVRTKLFDDARGTASFYVETSRREAIGSTANVKTLQQTLFVEMKRETETWKVSRATWQNP